ncbi:hypothetical protein EDB81DRAFT_758627 [Dactylonectria macrodidyma]|uniref:Uncharacterized protein n=1 Tax=Dactylonectria macrodidyma TaxID=307937 RepID=A0A9P9J9I3_9HYPO|nr:hypothetical protein EDB81DRAFT_758627 [Dactylonectria macrodidyma]
MRLYEPQGRYDEAETLKDRALDLGREVVGKKHPDTIRSMASLAAMFHAQGRYDEAGVLHKTALDLRRRILREDYPHTTQSIILWRSRRSAIQNSGSRAIDLYGRLWCVYIIVKEDDKLPAMAGLAARFALNGTSNEDRSVPDNSYLAGLWTEDLLRGLCWNVDRHYPLGGAPSAYTAPSWSWASVKSAIDYASDWFGTIEELAVVQGAGVNVESTGNAFGKVTGGWMHLSVTKLRLYQKYVKHFLCFREGEAVFRITVFWDSARYGLPDYDHLAKSNAIDLEDLGTPKCVTCFNLLDQDAVLVRLSL